MMTDPTVDERDPDAILASGRYVDRRGRGWDYVETMGAWSAPEIDDEGISWGCHWLDPDQMRLLIIRDQHRNECPRLAFCANHPVPSVTSDNLLRLSFDAWSAGPHTDEDLDRPSYPTLAEAFAAAEALATGVGASGESAIETGSELDPPVKPVGTSGGTWKETDRILTRRRDSPMAEKYIDLADRICVALRQRDESWGVLSTLRWLDEHRDEVPKPTITESDVRKAAEAAKALPNG